MKKAQTLLALIFIPMLAGAGDGLFLPKPDAPPQRGVEKGYFYFRVPIQKEQITDIVLRPDTEDPKQFWLEIHLTRYADPGDFYYFPLHDNELDGFVVRQSELNKDGCKWARGFIDIDEARAAFGDIISAHKIAKSHAEDRTKG